jgi:thioredoxin-related protein
MKKVLIIAGFIAAGFGIYSFTMYRSGNVAETTEVTTEGAVKWYTWNEAIEANKTKPKKIIVDVFTDWCGWCKVMDRETFPNADVAKYLNDNFYPVKFNAEQREEITFNGQKFNYVAQGKGGYHTLAATLLDGQMSYPTVVYLNEKLERIMISPGFKKPEDLMKELKYTSEEQYSKITFDEYRSKSK